MALSEDTHIKIQRYLDQEMEEQERVAFEKAIKNDKELAGEVALHQDMETFLADTPENNLRKSLQILNEQVDKDDRPSGNWLKNLFWLIPVVLIGAWWVLTPGQSMDDTRKAPDHTTEQSPTTPQKKTTPETETTEQVQPPPEETTEEDPVPVTPEKSDQEEATEEVEQDAEPLDPPPPIAANFDPNPSLEFLIENNVRDAEFELEVENAPGDISLPSLAEPFNFQFGAVITSEENLLDQDFKLYLFSNDRADFQNFRPLSTNDLTLNKTADDTFRIDFQKNMTLSPGLYYYMLEDFAEEQIYFVQKFRVTVGR